MTGSEAQRFLDYLFCQALIRVYGPWAGNKTIRQSERELAEKRVFNATVTLSTVQADEVTGAWRVSA
jgi:hypothetical protein